MHETSQRSSKKLSFRDFENTFVWCVSQSVDSLLFLRENTISPHKNWNDKFSGSECIMFLQFRDVFLLNSELRKLLNLKFVEAIQMSLSVACILLYFCFDFL